MAPPISHSAPRPPPTTRSADPSPIARPTPTPHAPPTADTARFRDSFVSDGAARERMAHATGRGLTDQVGNGRDLAERMSDRPIAWDNPADTLAHHGQLDASSTTRGDADRCGATALVGGLVMSGPEAPRRLSDARGRVESQLAVVDRGLSARSDREWSSTDPTAFSGMRDAREAHQLLDGLPRDTSTWTHRDLSHFEEATYRLGRAEQALHGDHSAGGLVGSEMRSLRETVWGQRPDGTPWHPTTADGREVDVVFAGTRDTGGPRALNHFVLGTDTPVSEGRRGVVYDPWPLDNGTNFVRQDGQPERLLGAGGLLESGAPGAPQTGMDIDWWPPIRD